MRNHIKILLREGLLSENKLYGKKIIEPLLKKLNDSSDDTINKIAIAGLFRGNFPPIQNIKTKEQLDTEFNTWYNNVIGELTKNTKTFVDDDDLAKKYLDAYVNNVKSLGGNARPFSIKNIEKTFVDIINNNGWVEGDNTIIGNDIYNPNSDDIVYSGSEIVILNSNTKAKCVMYGKDESWCIGKSELNYYNTYRIKDGATPYHVLQKNVDGNEHKLVIMNYGKRGYAIADRGNSDRHGGPTQATSWGEIENQLPNLSGLEQYFPYREVTEDEKNYELILNRTKGYEGDNLMGYIQHNIKGLILGGSPVRSEDFIRDYAALGVNIPFRQLKSLDDVTMNSLIESGYFINHSLHNYEILSDTQKRRVVNLIIDNNNEHNPRFLTDQEYSFASDKFKVKYLGDLVTRQQLHVLTDEQYADTDNHIKSTYIHAIGYSRDKILTVNQFNITPEHLQLKYIDALYMNGNYLGVEMYVNASDNVKLKYIEMLAKSGVGLTDEQYADAPDNLKSKYIESRVKGKKGSLSTQEYTDASDNVKLEYLNLLIKRPLFNAHYETPIILKDLLNYKFKDLVNGKNRFYQLLFGQERVWSNDGEDRKDEEIIDYIINNNKLLNDINGATFPVLVRHTENPEKVFNVFSDERIVQMLSDAPPLGKLKHANSKNQEMVTKLLQKYEQGTVNENTIKTQFRNKILKNLSSIDILSTLHSI